MEKKFRPSRMENRHFCLSERPSHFSKGALRADTMAYCLAATASDKAESGNRMYHCACLGQPSSTEQLRALRRVQNALRALLGHVRRAAPAAWVAHWHSSEPEQDQQERLSAPRLQSGGQSYLKLRAFFGCFCVIELKIFFAGLRPAPRWGSRPRPRSGRSSPSALSGGAHPG